MAEVTATVGKIIEIEVREVLEDGSVVLYCPRWEPPEQIAAVGDRIVVVSPRLSGVKKNEG